VLKIGEVHRVTRVHRRLGGKGVNVARVLTALSRHAIAVVPGPAGLGAEVGLDVVPGLPAIRQTLVVQGADGATTSLWEPGIEPAAGTERALIDRVRAWLRPDEATGIVVSGSLPPGFDSRFHAQAAAAALEAGVPAVVDTSGEALAHAASVPGVVLAPNAAELAELTGTPCEGPAEAIATARGLLPGGPLAVVVTLGKSGLAAVTRDGIWHGRLPESLAGNPTGAGDAAAAALIAGLADKVSKTGRAGWPETVRDAVALSAAAVLSSVAGEVSPTDYAGFRARTEVREVA
jgi:1-phosphofructokinase/tagatose 6-phosphate kinase